ncbi:hypothetical protein [Streptomyces brevispora]|uniref:Flagellar protein FlbD n=1 Tax=Streptomyces brevispora TaxID=887462 RepID=A0ABZ1G4Y2_9ACTN|nr:hypothetical protein [Streptomyces brevispora]WSC14323.1 hypothetical protein OIE64_16735 [Streptomyces brevispora]
MNNASTKQSSVRYATSANLPAGRGVVVIETLNGPVMVVREGKMTVELVEEIVEMYDALAGRGMLGQQQEE